MSQPEKIVTARKARQQKLAALAVQGKPMKEIAEEMGYTGPYPAQTVYSSLKKKGAQAEIKALQAEMKYGVDECLAELEEALQLARAKGNTQSMIAATLGKAKVKGLLIDKTQDITIVDRGKARMAADEALAALTVSEHGIERESVESTVENKEQALCNAST